MTKKSIKKIIDSELSNIIKCLKKRSKFESDSDSDSESGYESRMSEGPEGTDYESDYSRSSKRSSRSNKSRSSRSSRSVRSSSYDNESRVSGTDYESDNESRVSGGPTETDYESDDEDYSEYKLVLTKYGKGYLLKGVTRPIKEVIMELGGTWNRTLGGWIFGPKRVLKLVETLGPKRDF